MHRIDSLNAENNRFVDGNPNAGKKGTIVDASWLNSTQEEIAKTIEDAGMRLDKNNDNQLTPAIRNIITDSLQPYQFTQDITSTTSWTSVGGVVEIKKGSIVDVTIGILVSNEAPDQLIVKTKIDEKNQRANFILSVKGYQSKRLTFVADKDMKGTDFAEYTFVNGNQLATATLFFNGFISKI